MIQFEFSLIPLGKIFLCFLRSSAPVLRGERWHRPWAAAGPSGGVWCMGKTGWETCRGRLVWGARGEKNRKEKEGEMGHCSSQLGRALENKKGVRWTWFKGEKENGPGPGLSIENTFLFSNLL
jgi:hypothetical protein